MLGAAAIGDRAEDREQFEALPVLVVSGYADLDSLSPSFPHLSKPFRQAELAKALEKVTA